MAPLGLRPENSTLVHVLVHRESEEYKEEDDESGSRVTSPAMSMGMEKHKPPQIRISPGSDDLDPTSLDSVQLSTVQIMIESPKEPPRGDFSADYEIPPPPLSSIQTEEEGVADVIEEPIDVNIQGDTSKVFYDYNPDDANEISSVGDFN
ncbi:hypothetical protein DOY81_010270 [Sarcophaga bullata]|nr:hypothetical protein DOY81_010270 [Sarcophaga bullata]